MFTGLIEDIGRILGVRRSSKDVTFTIQSKISKDMTIGQSIAVNGACLTITSYQTVSMQVHAVEETLTHTNLSSLQIGSQVHLERALKFNERLNGHFVQGHIDGVGELVRISKIGESNVLRITPPQNLLKFIVPKGSIALSGISLTVVEVNTTNFTVSIIPHTFVNTLIHKWKVKEKINIEVDILAKYVEKLTIQKD